MRDEREGGGREGGERVEGGWREGGGRVELIWGGGYWMKGAEAGARGGGGEVLKKMLYNEVANVDEL